MKRYTLFLIAGLLALALTGCSQSSKSENVTQNSFKSQTSQIGELIKPEHITLVVDGSFIADSEKRLAAQEKFQSLTGISLEIKDFDKYAETIEADVMMVSSDYYALYAEEGCFWDMAQAWENSETKQSGRMNESIVNEFYLEGKLYGFPVSSGNGLVTYIRKDWLDKLGLDIPVTYNEYLNVLRAFRDKDPDGNGKADTYGVTGTGLITYTEPYVQYLPEFWQEAYPGIYKNQQGEYVDGFTEESMVKALSRLKEAYSEGLIDQEIITNNASNCREKFYSSKAGVYTYKAGDWNMILENHLKNLVPEGEVIAIPPIEETKNYIKDLSFSFAIPSDNSNPQGIFKYFIEALVDGGPIQELFSYGIEGTDWKKTAEGYQMIADSEDSLEETNKPLINPLLSISKWLPEYNKEWLTESKVKASNEILQNHCKLQPILKYTDVMTDLNVELSDCRSQLIAEVVTGDLSVEEGMKKYHEQMDGIVSSILESLNG